MADFSSHDALCLARRFKVSSCTCGANRQLNKPWRTEWHDEPMESGTKSRALIDKPLNSHELREMGVRAVSKKTLQNRARVQKHRAKLKENLHGS